MSLESQYRRIRNLYGEESRARLNERLLFVLKVEGGDEMIPAYVAKEVHRSRSWTSDWLARYHKEGIDGLENRHKRGRPSKLLEVVVKLRKKAEGK